MQNSTQQALSSRLNQLKQQMFSTQDYVKKNPLKSLALALIAAKFFTRRR